MPVSSPRAQEVAERLGQYADVGDGEVHALGAGGRHDVRGVAGQEQPAVAHRLGHEAAHAGHALLEHRALVEREARRPAAGGCPARPRSARRTSRRRRSSGRHLQVQPGDLGAAHASSSAKPFVVVGVDELVGASAAASARMPSQANGYVALVDAAARRSGDGAADPVEAVAAGDHVAAQLLAPSVGVGEADHGASERDAVAASRRRPRSAGRRRRPSRAAIEVLDDLLLPVDGDGRGRRGRRSRCGGRRPPSKRSEMPSCARPSRSSRSAERRPRAAARPSGAPARRRAPAARRRPGCGDSRTTESMPWRAAGATAAAPPVPPRRSRPGCASREPDAPSGNTRLDFR